MTHKHWSDNFSWTTLELRLIEEETTLQSPSEQPTVNVFFVNIDITEQSCCTGWTLFCPFPWGLLETDMWIQSGMSPTTVFGQSSVWVGSSCHCSSNCIYSPNQICWLSCQSHSTTFMKRRCIPLLRCQVWDEDAGWQRQHLIENQKWTGCRARREYKNRPG